MSLTPQQVRRATRTLHLLGAAVAAIAIYVPVVPADLARLLLAAVAVPLLALSGLVLAQQGRLRKLLRGTSRRSADRRAVRPGGGLPLG